MQLIFGLGAVGVLGQVLLKGAALIGLAAAALVGAAVLLLPI